jgi:hypothetical protein
MSGSPKDILGTADLSGVRNDSSYSPDVVRAHLNAHGVTLDYGKLSVIVEQAAVDDAERAVAAATPEDRRIGMWKPQATEGQVHEGSCQSLLRRHCAMARAEEAG